MSGPIRDYSNHARNRAAERDVEITGIETCVIEGNFDWNLVEIHTDVGVTGIGESSRGGSVANLVRYMEGFLVGENPLDVEWLFRRMIQETAGHGGKYRDAIRIYCDCHAGEAYAVDHGYTDYGDTNAYASSSEYGFLAHKTVCK